MRDRPVAKTSTRTAHNIHKKNIHAPGGIFFFEPAIPAKRMMQTYALDRTATGIVPIEVNILSFKEKQWEDLNQN